MKFPFCFKIEPKLFNNANRRPLPPPGYVKFNSSKANCQSEKCPNCGAEKPATAGGHGGFLDKDIMAVDRAMTRLWEKRWDLLHKPHFDLFCADVSNPGEERLMLKCHPSRFGVSEFCCCGAKIWHDFFEYPWDYYYLPKNKEGKSVIQKSLLGVI